MTQDDPPNMVQLLDCGTKRSRMLATPCLRISNTLDRHRSSHSDAESWSKLIISYYIYRQMVSKHPAQNLQKKVNIKVNIKQLRHTKTTSASHCQSLLKKPCTSSYFIPSPHPTSIQSMAPDGAHHPIATTTRCKPRPNSRCPPRPLRLQAVPRPPPPHIRDPRKSPGCPARLRIAEKFWSQLFAHSCCFTARNPLNGWSS